MFDREQSVNEAIAIDVSSTDQSFSNAPLRSLYVGASGTVAVELYGRPGVSVSYTVFAGQRLPLRITTVYKSGTTATLMVGER